MSGKFRPGGEFLFFRKFNDAIFTREDLTEEQKSYGELVRKFVLKEVLPLNDLIEKKEKVDYNGQNMPVQLMLLKKMADLGITMIDLPEDFGGIGLDKTTSMHMTENLIGNASMTATLGANAGIGTLPILYFGNEKQKEAILPYLATTEKISCYALTEPGSGSDALSGKTTAVLSPDGNFYILNGSKQFITNAAWADYAIVFTGINGKYSCLIVDLKTEGVIIGAEEKKMGLKGSSTTSLSFDNVIVPKENLLGNIGDAPTIALNILNLGRLKLGFHTLGEAKYSFDLTMKYCADRKQFGQSITNFDAQKARTAEMASRIFAVDSFLYNVVSEIDRDLSKLSKEEQYGLKAIDVIKTFAMEASMVKIAGSELLSMVAEKSVKMHGGYGFVEEYHVERIMRDNVIDMIFEGTNDINRLVIFDTITRNIFSGTINWREGIQEIERLIANNHLQFCSEDKLLDESLKTVMILKLMTAFSFNELLIHTGKDIKNNQMAIFNMTDILLELSLADSSLSRIHKLSLSNEKQRKFHSDLLSLIVVQAREKILALLKQIFFSVLPKDQFPAKMKTFNTLAEALPEYPDIFQLKRTVAEEFNYNGKYYL